MPRPEHRCDVFAAQHPSRRPLRSRSGDHGGVGKPLLLCSLTLLVSALCLTTPIFACPPSDLGLERQILWADQAMHVEILGVEVVPWNPEARYLDPESWPWWLTSKEMLTEDGLPKAEILQALERHARPISIDGQASHVVVRTRVLDHLRAGAPKAAETFYFLHNPWIYRQAIPGKEAFLFVRRARNSETFLGLVPVIATDSVMALADHYSSGEMAALIRHGFASRAQQEAARANGVVPKDEPIDMREWRWRAIQSPTTRTFLTPWKLGEGFSQEKVAELVLAPGMGTLHDLDLFTAVLDYESAELDQWILDWMTSAFVAENPRFALLGFSRALKRWGVSDVEERLEEARIADRRNELEDLWKVTVEELGLPPGFPSLAPTMRAQKAEEDGRMSYFGQLLDDLASRRSETPAPPLTD